MDVILRPIFSVLTVPDLKIKQPTWLHVSIFFTWMKSMSLHLFSDSLRLDHIRLHPHHLLSGHGRHHLRRNCWATQVELCFKNYLHVTRLCFDSFISWQCWVHYRWAWSHKASSIHAIQGQRAVHHGGKYRYFYCPMTLFNILGAC